MIRRMSKTVKMSSVASQYALKEAGIENPDAIITGTGMGCSQDSEKFLKNVMDNHEEFLTPTFYSVYSQYGCRTNCFRFAMSRVQFHVCKHFFISGIFVFRCKITDQ
jgi:hypothetical protein